MTFYGASDLDIALQDGGVPVTVGAVNGRGLEDAPDESQLQETAPHLVGRVRTVVVKTGTFTLAPKGDITVDGTAYKIHSLERFDDGAWTRVTVVKVN